ncbi:hypothetical protein EDF78_11725 [Rahnella sp. BIGb0236]|nr:hypothetical protein EDF78_11725 [Rahnella sp. BIGb0236]
MSSGVGRKERNIFRKSPGYRKAIDLNNRLLPGTLIVDKIVFYWTFVMSEQKCEQVQIT